MFKIKSTRLSLVLSTLAVILCFSTLGGATYALFTYEEPAANVLVMSGGVLVDIQDENGLTLEGQELLFRDANGKTDIRWEPGACYYTDPFYIKNLGDITLNFRILLTGSGMEDAEFLIAFDPCIVDENDEEVDLSQYQHELTAGQTSGEFRIRMKMRETIGNQFNDRTFGGVAVTVYAIQGGVDAFDQQPMP